MTLEELLNEVRQGGRVCPLPPKRNDLWKMLSSKGIVGDGQAPSAPLILAAWNFTSDEDKAVRLAEHIQWAESHGVLQQVCDFIKDMNEEDWYCGD